MYVHLNLKVGLLEPTQTSCRYSVPMHVIGSLDVCGAKGTRGCRAGFVGLWPRVGRRLTEGHFRYELVAEG